MLARLWALPTPGASSGVHLCTALFLWLDIFPSCVIALAALFWRSMWMHETTLASERITPEFGAPACRKFRVVPAALYLEHFASDRSHMLEEGSPPVAHTYSQAPPGYDCIVSPRELPVSVFSGFTLCPCGVPAAHAIGKEHVCR